jgi:hypothetical protein
VVLSKSIEDMTEEASAVVHAVVRQRQSAWDEAHRRIYTFTELELRDAWLGAPDATLVVRTLGGEVGSVGMKVSGTPRFEVGEEVVLFLRADPLDGERYQVVGMSQGKFRVEQRSEGAFAVPDAKGLMFASRDDSGGLAVSRGPPSGPAPVPLDDLEARVRSAAEADGPTLRSVPPPAPSTPAPPTPAPAPAPSPKGDR